MRSPFSLQILLRLWSIICQNVVQLPALLHLGAQFTTSLRLVERLYRGPKKSEKFIVFTQLFDEY